MTWFTQTFHWKHHQFNRLFTFSNRVCHAKCIRLKPNHLSILFGSVYPLNIRPIFDIFFSALEVPKVTVWTLVCAVISISAKTYSFIFRCNDEGNSRSENVSLFIRWVCLFCLPSQRFDSTFDWTINCWHCITADLKTINIDRKHFNLDWLISKCRFDANLKRGNLQSESVCGRSSINNVMRWRRRFASIRYWTRFNL